MADNLQIYNAVRSVPPAAIKEIKGGRLNGYSDINPVWRIKTLTEQFGICGIGWSYEVISKRLEPAPDGQIAAFVDIVLFIKVDGEWSRGIPGTGGSMFVAKERSGNYTSDEAFKMALTDAISVSCKALGIGADVYWNKDASKYAASPDTPVQPKPPQNATGAVTAPNKLTKTEAAIIIETLEAKNPDVKGDKEKLVARFKELTGYASLGDVPPSEFETVMTAIGSPLPF